MDIRYRCKETVNGAPAEQKIGFYQARYDGNRIKQICWLAQICAGRRVLHKKGNRCREETCAEMKRKCFADYKNRKVFDFGSFMGRLINYDVVSFDIFDTLITRTVRHPTDVFGMLEKRTGIQGFARCRIEAETAARQYRYARHHSGEVTIEEIYRTILQDSRIRGRGSGCETAPLKQELKAWIHMEMEMEKQCCKADAVMQEMVRLLLAQGKRVIAVSDMYLHQGQIAELLQICGYHNLKEIYVSCDYRAGKSDGRLFPLVRQKLGSDKKLIHIGDDFYADVYKPKELDISAVHYIS